MPKVNALGLRLGLRSMTVVFAVVILVLAWISVGVVLQSKWDDAIEAEFRQNTNLARALQEQTVRVLASVDQATLRMRDAVLENSPPTQPLPRGYTPTLQASFYAQYANETGLTPHILTQLSLVGPDGRFLGSNIDPTGERTGHVDLSDREHIQVHLKPSQTNAPLQLMTSNGLFIGKPVLGKVSGKWTVQVSRKVARSDGTVLGVIVASINPSYFEQVYQQVQLGRSGGITLIGDDNTIRARVVGGESKGMGTAVQLPPNHPSRTGWKEEGHYISRSAVDGVERIFGFHRVGSYPLIVGVSTSIDTATAEWEDTRNVALVLMALFSLAMIGGMLVFIGSLRQLELKNASLQLSEAQAQSANRAKSEFLAAISHELRTPLTSIRGFAELMELRLEQPKFKEAATLIRKASEHLNTLLSEILDLAKVEAGAMPITPEPQNIHELVQATADFFALSASDKNLSLDVSVAPGTPDHLTCDGLRLKQILNNLISNAIKFTEHGGVRIEVEATDSRVLFHVVDTGAGIPAHLHDTIFEKFRQGNDRVSYEHGGTGLGLALSRALADLMQGSLSVQSEEGRGSRFTLALPKR